MPFIDVSAVWGYSTPALAFDHMSIKDQQYPTTAQNYRLSGAVSWLILLAVLQLEMPLLHYESLYIVAIFRLDPDTQ
jgi:hypothetical protein